MRFGGFQEAKLRVSCFFSLFSSQSGARQHDLKSQECWHRYGRESDCGGPCRPQRQFPSLFSEDPGMLFGVKRAWLPWRQGCSLGILGGVGGSGNGPVRDTQAYKRLSTSVHVSLTINVFKCMEEIQDYSVDSHWKEAQILVYKQAQPENLVSFSQTGFEILTSSFPFGTPSGPWLRSIQPQSHDIFRVSWKFLVRISNTMFLILDMRSEFGSENTVTVYLG